MSPSKSNRDIHASARDASDHDLFVSRFGGTIVASVAQVPMPDLLSEAEADVARGILFGDSNKAIAARRGCSAKTVANHLAAIYAKLGVRSRDELAALLVRRGRGQTER